MCTDINTEYWSEHSFKRYDKKLDKKNMIRKLELTFVLTNTELGQVDNSTFCMIVPKNRKHLKRIYSLGEKIFS